ncbi:MAG: lysophospholipid acyltransferase family protein [Deltaproteobacteria bacterium]|nr:lysophospholipid acyltransferase family protein [Deltaproteobacteria bacterium]
MLGKKAEEIVDGRNAMAGRASGFAEGDGRAIMPREVFLSIKSRWSQMGQIKRMLLNRMLVLGLVWLVFRTTRVQWINRHVLDELSESGKPYIAALWHNNLLYFVPLLAPLGLYGMVSRSRDGDDIAWVMSRFGFPVVRGSSSRGSVGVLRECMALLSKGRGVIMTPDGPRGPRYQLKPGLAALARKKGVPIVPLCYSAPRRWQINSWDRMRLPRPFSRLTVVVGHPIWCSEGDGTLEFQQEHVQEEMKKLVLVAEKYTGAWEKYHDPLLENPS